MTALCPASTCAAPTASKLGLSCCCFVCWVHSHSKKKYGYGKNKYSKEDKYEHEDK